MIVIYGHLGMMLVSRQIFDPVESIFYADNLVMLASTVFEVILYLSLFKATMVMFNPFGMDEDDFEVSFKKFL